MKTDELEMQAFVRDGLENCYVKAKASVTAFETSIKDLLTEQLKAMPDCSILPTKGRQVGKPGAWDDSEKMFIYARLFANDEDYLELGIEWKTVEPGRPILYATWPDAEASTLRLAKPTAPVQSHREGFLFVPVSDGVRLEEAARSLLVETVRALGEMKAVR